MSSLRCFLLSVRSVESQCLTFFSLPWWKRQLEVLGAFVLDSLFLESRLWLEFKSLPCSTFWLYILSQLCFSRPIVRKRQCSLQFIARIPKSRFYASKELLLLLSMCRVKCLFRLVALL